MKLYIDCWSRIALGAVVCLAVLVTDVNGQAVKATLLGTVTDSSGAVVPEAQVLITETNTNFHRPIVTNSSGNYVAGNLDPGVYRVEVQHPGFRTAVSTNVDVLVNTTLRVDLQLAPGEVTEVVEVVQTLAPLQTDRADVGRKIERRQLADLPLLMNRNFQGLVNLVPGTRPSFRPHSEFFNAQDSMSTQVNGQSRMANNVQFEGIDNNHRTGLLTVMIPPIESLETVDVTTSNYEAELGRAGGAVVNVTLKSGTNDWHGSAYLFNRVSATGAKNVFAVSKSPTVFNQFGGTLGGPIRRDKTFFFVSYQEIRDRRGDVTRATIPTPDFRQGNLSAAPTNIYDPNTGSSDGKGRTQFGNNVIPASRISPVAQGILTLVPQPTSSGLVTNYERATVRKKDTKSLDFKIDHLLRETDQFSVRYSLQQPEIFDPSLFGIYGGPKSGGFAGLGTQRAQNGAVNYAHIFSPLFMAEFRIGIMRYRNDAKNEDAGKRTAEELGIPVEVRSGDRPPSHRLAAVERDLLLDLDRHDVLTVQEIDWTESSDVETISFPVWTAPQAPPQSQPKRCKRRCKTTLIFGAAFVAAGTAMAVLINDPPCGQAPYYPCPVGVRNMPRKVGIGVAILGGAMIVSGVTSGRE